LAVSTAALAHLGVGLAGTSCSAPTADLPTAVFDSGALDAAFASDAIATLDARGTFPDEGGCKPSNAQFSPVYEPPTAAYPGACSLDQMTSLVAACFGDHKTVSACNAWIGMADNAGCLGCWATPVSATSWGPIVYSTSSEKGQAIFVNVGGCIALADPSQLSCAKDVEYSLECVLSACADACPIPESGDTTTAMSELEACIQAAEKGGCSEYSKPAEACTKTLSKSNPADAPASFCASAGTDSRDLLEYLVLACGTPVTSADAGSPAPPDAGLDAAAAPDSEK
jgi:hypothetical protein